MTVTWGDIREVNMMTVKTLRLTEETHVTGAGEEICGVARKPPSVSKVSKGRSEESWKHPV